MDAITSMKNEVSRIREAMEECVTESGFIKPECRGRYYILAQKHRSLHDSIQWMVDLYHPAGRLVPDPHES